jgi:hypothetical protein
MPPPRRRAKCQGQQPLLPLWWFRFFPTRWSLLFNSCDGADMMVDFREPMRGLVTKEKPAHRLFADDRASYSELFLLLRGHSDRTRALAVRRATTRRATTGPVGTANHAGDYTDGPGGRQIGSLRPTYSCNAHRLAAEQAPTLTPAPEGCREGYGLGCPSQFLPAGRSN